MLLYDPPTLQLIAAARAGDTAALDALIARYLPLVYNIVGRALNGHADVDDVVQETMLRVVNGLGELRDPESFRSWLVAITTYQIRDRVREQQTRTARLDVLDETRDVAAPGSDFADLTILRLQLSGQRRQIAEATAWLDQDDRELLSLWWLEAAGELTRAELATALDLPLAHAAVRVQRMKAQLEAGRAVVTALNADPRCPDLHTVIRDWDSRPSPLWRKRIARHTRDCPACNGTWVALVPAERLLSGLALVPLPLGLVMHGLAGAGPGAWHAALAAKSTGWLAWTTQTALAKPVIATVTGLSVLAGGSAVYLTHSTPPPKSLISIPPPAATTVSSPEPSTSPGLRRTPRAAVTPIAPKPRYGSVVDQVDAAPPKTRKPRTLPHRPEGTLAVVAGRPADPKVMVYRGDFMTLRGKGYFQVVYQTVYTQRSGSMVMPTWTGLEGRLFHVASGGGLRMDDTRPGEPRNHTFMGDPDAGYIELPPGAQQIWETEYFYLDGEVTLHQNERGADYNLYPTITNWQRVDDEINQAPSSDGPIRYGLTRDVGTDATPVPQYLTRRDLEPASVPQRTRVS